MKKFHLKICLAFIFLFVFGGSVFGQNIDSDSSEIEDDFFEYKKDTLLISISNDAMNVLYIGLDNPVSIAVSGYTADKIVAKISHGNISHGNISTYGNNYLVKVTKRGEVNIEIYVIEKDSSLKYLGTKKFRVREIPKPEAQLGTLTNGCYENISVILANGNKVYASLGNAFMFDGVKYNITGFRFTVAKKEGESKATVQVNGNRLNEDCRLLLSDLASGDKIIIDGIKSIGPGGRKELAPIVITAR